MKARTFILTAGAVVAVAVPVAQATPLYPEGDGSAAAFYSARALQAMGGRYQAAAQSYAVRATRPDDRAGIRGVGIGRLAQADQTDALSRYLVNHTTAVRPDDRAGPRGIGETPVDVVGGSPSSGFDWRDTGIGVGSAGVLLLLGASLAATTRRRSASALG